jgi:hypothetical protein
VTKGLTPRLVVVGLVDIMKISPITKPSYAPDLLQTPSATSPPIEPHIDSANMLRTIRPRRRSNMDEDGNEPRGRTTAGDGPGSRPTGRPRSGHINSSPHEPGMDEASPRRSSMDGAAASTSPAIAAQTPAPETPSAETHNQPRVSPAPEEASAPADTTPVQSPLPEASSAAMPQDPSAPKNYPMHIRVELYARQQYVSTAAEYNVSRLSCNLNHVNFVFGWEAGEKFGFTHRRPEAGIIGCAILDRRGGMPSDTFVLADLEFDSQREIFDRCDQMRNDSDDNADIQLSLLYKPELVPFDRCRPPPSQAESLHNCSGLTPLIAMD